MLQKKCFTTHHKKHFLLSFLFFVLINHSSSIKSACTPIASLPGQTIWTLLDRAQKALLGPMTFYIRQSNLPMTITDPGYYVLSCGTRLDTGAMTAPAITFATDNVTLDLQGIGIRQNFNTASATYAIDINGHSNITIVDGILGQSGVSIAVGNANSAFITFGTTGTSANVTLRNVRTISGNGVDIKSLFGAPAITVQGLLMQGCVFISGNASPNVQNSVDIGFLTQSLIIDNFVRDTNNAFRIRGGTDNIIARCYAVGCDTAGFLITGASNMILYQCAVNNSLFGFNIGATASNVLMLGCSMDGVGTAVTTGFMTASLTHFINNCFAGANANNYNGAFTGATFGPGQVTDANYWLSLSA